MRQDYASEMPGTQAFHVRIGIFIANQYCTVMLVRIMINKRTYAWIIWLVAALFYSIEFLQRVAPGVIAKPLMNTYHFDTETLGFIISFYFYAYAITQLPVGIILDRYGARISLACAALAVSFGTFLFSYTGHVAILICARIIVGIGSAFAFVGCLKLAKNWFDQQSFGLIVGLTNTLGVLGALFGEEPLSKLVALWGWQPTLQFTSVLGIIISLLILIVVRERPASEAAQQPTLTAAHVWSSLKEIILNKQSWLIGIYAGLMVAPVIAFAELWAVTFLQKAHHITPELAAQANSLIFVGIAVGGPLNGWISGLLRRRKLVMLVGNIMALLLLTTVLLIGNINFVILEILLFLFGMFTSSMLVCFSLATEQHEEAMSATVIAFTNMMIMIIGAIFQPMIGTIVHHLMQSQNAAQYTAGEFRTALLVLPVALIINLIIFIFIKETRCKNICK